MSGRERPQVGDLVVVESRPALGVGRLVALIDGWGRVHFYDDGTLELILLDELTRAPPGRWDKGR